MTRKSRRLTLIAACIATLGLAAGLALYALRDNVVFFYGPSEVAQKAPAPGARLRVGGLVKDGSVTRGSGRMAFTITDGKHDVHVDYVGVAPDLFREGQGVVAEGALVGPAELDADSVLAKHDERYMPREVADALKKQGVWQENAAMQGATP